MLTTLSSFAYSKSAQSDLGCQERSVPVVRLTIPLALPTLHRAGDIECKLVAAILLRHGKRRLAIGGAIRGSTAQERQQVCPRKSGVVGGMFR